MNIFADTNWLEAIYFKPTKESKEATKRRHALVERRMRKLSSPLLTSQIVLLEARNVFSRLAGVPKPAEWDRLVGDFNGRIFVDPMNWDILRQQTNRVFERFSHKTVVGTFDAALIASAQLAGAREFFSFDEHLKALATCLDMDVYPPLGTEGKKLLTKFRSWK